jgi:hypothetical protein
MQQGVRRLADRVDQQAAGHSPMHSPQDRHPFPPTRAYDSQMLPA